MKKWMAVLLVLVLVLICALTACGKNKISHDDGDNGGETEVEQGRTAQECLSAVVNAKAPEDMDDLVTNNYDGYFDRIKETLPADKYTVTANKIGSYGEHDVYSCTIKETAKPESSITCLEVFKKGDGGYRIETNQEILDEIVEKCMCGTCNGSGKTAVQGNTCAICAGTGVQYYPNTYYDAATNMWMGETRACSGCAGAGTLGGAASECPTCHGHGLAFR